MSVYREGKDPCRECAKREAEAKRPRPAYVDNSDRNFLIGVFTVAGLFAVTLVLGIVDSAYGDHSKECYRAVEHRDLTGHVYRTIAHLWSDPGERDMRTFDSLAEAQRFLAEKGAKVCP